MDFSTIFHLSLIFWIVLDSLGSVPLFVSVLKPFDPKTQRKIIIREMFIALAAMFFFLFLAEGFFKILGIEKSSLQIAGGIILFLISVRMIFAHPHHENSPHLHKEPLIVPLAIPTLAGPGMLTMITLYAGINGQLIVFIALIIAWIFSLPILLLATFLKKILGDNGLVAIERLFGYLIVLIAVKVITTGLFSVFGIQAS